MPHEARRDVDLVEHIGLVGRDDRHAEHLAEAGRKDEQPQQRPDQRRDEPFALVEKAQAFADQDALQAKPGDSSSCRRAACPAAWLA